MGSRVGKLVKKSDEKVMKMLDMESYPWLHFNEQSIIFPDNVKKTVILEKMHDPLEISEKVQTAKGFEQPFADKSKPLIPTDMTEDYKKGQREMIKRRRRTLMDEEEAMALELAEIEHTEELKLENKDQKQKQKKGLIKFKNFNPNLTEEKKEIKVTEPEKVEEVKPQYINKPNESISPNHEEDIKQLELKLNQAKEEGFAKGQVEGFEKGEKEGREEGFKKGLEDGNSNGFRSGEERGLIAAESKYERAFANISEAAVRMDKLKVSILEEGKDIFLELAKLCCERILREQIRVNDSSLIKLFDEVIKLFSAKSALSIQMNPVDSQRIKKHLESLDEASRIQIKENSGLEIGSFQVENETGATLVDIKKNVEQVIQNIKDELFKDISSDTDEEHKDNPVLKKAV